MDEAQDFAPSSGVTISTASTLALASQARKYGLGLLFATQAPKGLHNQIPGNATTQFFGFLNVPVQIQAAKEMALAKGGNVSGIAQLRPGEFFVASDGLAFQRIRCPLCLSYHPKSPLTQEEIIQLAQR
jgi:DNA helicase HerA-like ATPase